MTIAESEPVIAIDNGIMLNSFPIDAIINTVYDLYAENTEVLIDEEWNSLAAVENVVATVYGQNFNDHFVLVRSFYKGVQGALKRGNLEETVHRLQTIVARLKLQEVESAAIIPLILEDQADRLYLSHLTLFSISMEAMWLVENIVKDFNYDGAPAFKKEYPQFAEACNELDRMMDSDGGQMEKDAHTALERMWYKLIPSLLRNKPTRYFHEYNRADSKDDPCCPDYAVLMNKGRFCFKSS